MRFQNLSDSIRKELERSISRGFTDYFVGLIGAPPKSGSQADAKYLGSGTLVRTNNCYGILTARHVVESKLYGQFDEIGITIANYPHRYTIPRYALVVSHVVAREPGLKDPDLTVLLIPSPHISEIEAKKSFWNLPKYGHKVKSIDLNDDNVLCSMIGCPDIYTKHIEPAIGFERTLKFQGVCGMTTPPTTLQRDGRAVYSICADYNWDDGLPRSFGGFSGGSLWCARLFYNEQSGASHDRPIFIGVPYWQSELRDGKRDILCHTAETIYSGAIAAMLSMSM